jgi:hypothetical protein
MVLIFVCDKLGIKTNRHKSLSKEYYGHMKNNITNDPLNPALRNFRTVLVQQNSARLTPLRQLAEGWEGSCSTK